MTPVIIICCIKRNVWIDKQRTGIFCVDYYHQIYELEVCLTGVSIIAKRAQTQNMLHRSRCCRIFYEVIWLWKLLHASVGSRHDLEHRQQVLGVAAHGTSADVLLVSARARRVLVVT